MSGVRCQVSGDAPLLQQIHGCCVQSETQGPSTVSVRSLRKRTDFARDDKSERIQQLRNCSSCEPRGFLMAGS